MSTAAVSSSQLKASIVPPRSVSRLVMTEVVEDEITSEVTPKAAEDVNGKKRSLEVMTTPTKDRSLRRRTSHTSVATPLQRAGVPDFSRPALRDLKTVVISLERRPDRMEGCQTRLQTHCPQLSAELFKATDGKQTKISTDEVVFNWNTARNVVYQKQRAIRKGWNDLDTYVVRDLILSPGERGCADSHIRCWRHCLELAGGTDKPLLVLEDDAAPTPEFVDRLEKAMSALPKDAEVLYLGYSQAAEWRKEISPELVESEYVWTTVAYVVWPSGAKKMLDRLPINEPVDNWMAALAADNTIKSYCVRPKIVLQADAWNVNSDVAHSDEHYWGPNSDIQHSDALYWGPDHPEAHAASASILGGLDAEDSEDEL
eukprot:TRINITY_DN26610_c0_g1_i2.p1 TRINITY_DN26610_c0_g1~~TRINITY_DN26610_c0_g1_i2.p1  ORF type:complete len:396 (-),score=78.13 TRINITY_DN26610_c0_g1_i2:263-1378(-)